MNRLDNSNLDPFDDGSLVYYCKFDVDIIDEINGQFSISNNVNLNFDCNDSRSAFFIDNTAYFRLPQITSVDNKSEFSFLMNFIIDTSTTNPEDKVVLFSFIDTNSGLTYKFIMFKNTPLKTYKLGITVNSFLNYSSRDFKISNTANGDCTSLNLACTNNGSTIKLFANGENILSLDRSISIDTDRIYIGNNLESLSSSFSGYIPYLYMFNRPLDVNEIKSFNNVLSTDPKIYYNLPTIIKNATSLIKFPLNDSAENLGSLDDGILTDVTFVENAGFFDGAALFDLETSNILMPTLQPYNGPTTISIFFKLDATVNQSVYTLFSSITDEGTMRSKLYIGYDSAADVYNIVFNDGATDFTFRANIDLYDYNSLMVVSNPNANRGTMIILNGEIIGVTNSSVTFGSLNYLGLAYPGVVQDQTTFYGYMDHVEIFDSYLSDYNLNKLLNFEKYNIPELHHSYINPFNDKSLVYKYTMENTTKEIISNRVASISDVSFDNDSKFENYAVRFNGVMADFNCGVMNYTINGGFTISLWIKLEDYKDDPRDHACIISNYIDNEDHTYTGLKVIANNLDTESITVIINGTETVINSKLRLNTYYNLVFVKDDSTSEFKVYLDGDLDSTIPSTSLTFSTNDFILGSSNYDKTECINGLIDNLEFFNKPLTDIEVKAISETL